MNIYEKLLAALKTKFQGVEDATLQRIASKKAEGVTDESKVNSIVEGISFQDVLTSYGDYRADGAQKTAVSNYEKKHNIKDGKPIEEPKPQPTSTPAPTPQPKPSEGVPAWAQALIDSNKALGERLNAMDDKNKADIRSKQIAEVAKEFGVEECTYKRLAIPEDADLKQYFSDYKQEITNARLQGSKSPEEGNHEHKDDMDSLLDGVNKRTEAIKTENEKK